MDARHDVTDLLVAWRDGNQDALAQLIPLVHDELRRIAHAYIARERPDQTLRTTALVNEAYLRLVDSSRVQWQHRAQFFAAAAGSMRRILVDYARRQHAGKRGGGLGALPLDEAAIVVEERAEMLIALDEALERLGAMDTRLRRAPPPSPRPTSRRNTGTPPLGTVACPSRRVAPAPRPARSASPRAPRRRSPPRRAGARRDRRRASRRVDGAHSPRGCAASTPPQPRRTARDAATGRASCRRAAGTPR